MCLITKCTVVELLLLMLDKTAFVRKCVNVSNPIMLIQCPASYQKLINMNQIPIAKYEYR